MLLLLHKKINIQNKQKKRTNKKHCRWYTRKHTQFKPQAAPASNVVPNKSRNRYQQMADSHREEEQVNLLGDEGIRAGGAGAQGQNLKLG